MKRRDFIALIGGVAAWPLAARAQQQPTMPVVGILGGHTSAEWIPFISAFNVGLKEIGFVEGQNVRIARGRQLRRPPGTDVTLRLWDSAAALVSAS